MIEGNRKPENEIRLLLYVDRGAMSTRRLKLAYQRRESQYTEWLKGQHPVSVTAPMFGCGVIVNPCRLKREELGLPPIPAGGGEVEYPDDWYEDSDLEQGVRIDPSPEEY